MSDLRLMRWEDWLDDSELDLVGRWIWARVASFPAGTCKLSNYSLARSMHVHEETVRSRLSAMTQMTPPLVKSEVLRKGAHFGQSLRTLVALRPDGSRAGGKLPNSELPNSELPNSELPNSELANSQPPQRKQVEENRSKKTEKRTLSLSARGAAKGDFSFPTRDDVMTELRKVLPDLRNVHGEIDAERFITDFLNKLPPGTAWQPLLRKYACNEAKLLMRAVGKTRARIQAVSGATLPADLMREVHELFHSTNEKAPDMMPGRGTMTK